MCSVRRAGEAAGGAAAGAAAGGAAAGGADGAAGAAAAARGAAAAGMGAGAAGADRGDGSEYVAHGAVRDGEKTESSLGMVEGWLAARRKGTGLKAVLGLLQLQIY